MHRGLRTGAILSLCAILNATLALAPGPLGSVPAFAATLPANGVNVNPSFRPWRNPTIVNPDSWWDPTNGPAKISSEIPLIQQLNAGILRIEFPWWSIENAGKGQFNWVQADLIVNSAAQAGVQLAPVLVFTPPWASGTCSNPVTNCTSSALAFTCPATAPSAKDFGDFVTAIATRYRGKIHFWEMWNEPDLAKYFQNGDPMLYATNVLVPGYNAVKAVDVSAQVILGGPSTPNTSWIQSVLNAGGTGHFDIMSFHDYNSSGSAILTDATSVASLASGKPLWLGEFGIQDTAGSTQTPLITGVLGVSSALSLGSWYELRDDQIMTDANTVCFSQNFGLTDHSYNKKTSFATFQTLGSPPPTILALAASVDGTDGALWVLRSGAANFTPAGGVLASTPAIIAVPQISGPALPLYVATGSDHDLWVRNDTSGWRRLTTSPVFCLDNPAGALIATTLYIACEGSDNALWHAETLAPTGTGLPTISASAWQSLGGVLTAGPGVSSLGGVPTYFVVGTDRNIWMRGLTTGWTQASWQCIGHPAAATFGSTTYFACHGLDNALWYATNTGSGWSQAQPLGGTLVDGVGIAAIASGAVFYGEGSDGALWHRTVSIGWSRDGGAIQHGAAATGL